MASSLNLDRNNGAEAFNIHLDPQGRLQFKANGNNGSGTTRVQIADDSGQVTIGGSGEFGQLQFSSPSDTNTIFLGAGGSEARLLLGGGNSGLVGVLQLGNAQNQTSINMQGSNGSIRAMSVTEISDIQFKTDISPLSKALDTILAMRGVRYSLKSAISSKETFGEHPQIGFIGQEMETVCPEVVSTDSNGYKSLNYSRLTALLVEAVKDQQKVIKQQVSALGEALAKIDRLEKSMQIQNT